MKFTKLGVALGTAALMAGIVVPGASAKAVPAKTILTPIVTGTVKFHGKPVAGATVKLYADPLPSTLRKVKIGGQVPDALIGETTTNKKGYYSVGVSAKGLATLRARAVRGVANLHVLAFTHGTTHEQVISVATDNPYCTTQEAAPGPVVITNSKANEYSGGVNILSVIGINLSAETDHDSSSVVEYTFPHGGPLCGLAGYPGSSNPGLVYAGYWEHSKKTPK